MSVALLPAPLIPPRHAADIIDRTRPVARKFRPDIEGLRAIAVLAVVLYHAGLGVRGGYVGVDVFFVISGFLITRQLLSSIERGGFRALPAFYAHRIRRLLPAAVVVVLATVVIARLVAPPLQVAAIARDGLFTVFYALNYRLAALGTQYMHQSDAVSPLQHFWSLGVEEQFYLFWPIVLALALWRAGRFRRIVLGVLLASLIVVSLLLCVRITASNQPWAYFSLWTRAWELGLGGLVAVGEPLAARIPRSVASWLAVLGVLAIVTSAFVLDDSTVFPGRAAAWPVVAATAVIAAGCGGRTAAERLLAEPAMQCVGRVSYSWYLWHWPMLILAPEVVGRPLGWVGRATVVWLSLAVAIVSYLRIEEPSRRRVLALGGWFRRGALMSAATVALTVLVATHPPSSTGQGAATTLAAGGTGSAATSEMDQAIAAGVQTRAVPMNLTPAVADAANDVPVSSGDGCHAGYTQISQGPCVFGDAAGTHTVVLFGDSHIEQWLPAFDAAALPAGWKVVNWTKAACPAAQLTVFAPALGRTYTECDTWRTRTIAAIGAMHPDLVVTGQSENTAASSVTPAAFADASVATVNALRAAGATHVTFMADIPIPNTDTPSCVAEHLADARACTFATTRAYTYPARHVAVDRAVHDAGYPVVDPQRWICTDRTCPAVVGNELVYRNSTHLTATFSTWLQGRVAPLLSIGG